MCIRDRAHSGGKEVVQQVEISGYRLVVVGTGVSYTTQNRLFIMFKYKRDYDYVDIMCTCDFVLNLLFLFN